MPQDDDPVRLVQPTLPLDVDAPIPFAPTARARRAVAPETLPPLRLVPVGGVAGVTPSRAATAGDAAPSLDPDDPRRARARALVRGGLTPAEVAEALDADEAAVVVWTSDLAAPSTGWRTPSSRTIGEVAAGAADHDQASAPIARGIDAGAGAARPGRDGATGVGAADRLDAVAPVTIAPVTVAPGDAAAADDTAARAAADGRFAAGLALVAANATTTPHGLVVRVEDRRLAARILRWLHQVGGVDPVRLRAIVVAPAGAAGDRLRHDLLRESELPADRVQVTRTNDRPGVVLRVTDPDMARRVERWQAALGPLLDGVAPTGAAPSPTPAPTPTTTPTSRDHAGPVAS